MKRFFSSVWLRILFCFCAVLAAQPTGLPGVEHISSQFSYSAQKWETTIKGHAVKLFWILAAIAAVWTFAVLVLRQADLADLIGAVVRFVFITLFF